VEVDQATDHSNAIVRPPLAWALAFIAGLLLDRLYPLPFLPPSFPARWLGIIVFAAAFGFALWAIATIRISGSAVETVNPTTTIVTYGPFEYTRNPIYLSMLVGQIGLAIGLNTLWILVTLIPFYFVLRYGVIAREESYLERKFGSAYLDYKARVRRWL
jgi:protein-S-isoprenylcysteine O-methyltransferase Ste14